jgi:hypothetical protein
VSLDKLKKEMGNGKVLLTIEEKMEKNVKELKH